MEEGEGAGSWKPAAPPRRPATACCLSRHHHPAPPLLLTLTFTPEYFSSAPALLPPAPPARPSGSSFSSSAAAPAAPGSRFCITSSPRPPGTSCGSGQGRWAGVGRVGGREGVSGPDTQAQMISSAPSPPSRPLCHRGPSTGKGAHTSKPHSTCRNPPPPPSPPPAPPPPRRHPPAQRCLGTAWPPA